MAGAAGAIKLESAKGEEGALLAGVSNTCDGADKPVSNAVTVAFVGVAKIILRAAPDEKVLMLGAFEGVSAILECTTLRPAALPCTVAETIEYDGRAAEDGIQKPLDGGPSAARPLILINGLW